MEILYKTTAGSRFELSSSNHSSVDEINVSLSHKHDEVTEFLKIVNSVSKNFDIISSKYRKMKNALLMSEDELLMCMPNNSLEASLDKVAELLKISLEDTENRDYLVTYLTIKRFLRGLRRPLIDETKLTQIIENTEHAAVAKNISSLSPEKDGAAKRSFYNMHGSATGRLTISEGPNILTMKSSARGCFKSRHNRGKILQIDLSAAEPNIALNFLGKPQEQDVYSHIADTVLKNRVSRGQAKIITLCALYGQSPKNLKGQLPESVSPDVVISKTREFFGSYDLEKKLLRDQKQNTLRNILGRPLNIKDTDRRLLVSYFLQSSAAEVSIVLFSEWMKRYKNLADPLYVIHDALLIDCSSQLSDSLLSKKIINLELGSWKFFANVTEVL